jgi:diacylglycerol O-acyltransferase / wax synthase
VGKTYDRLGAVDQAFFWLEQKTAPMHVASTLIFDAGDLQRTDGGINVHAIQHQIAARLHSIPRYRQKIRWVPLAQRPVWIDDPEFDLGYHVRHISLPRPGSDEQLKQVCAGLMEQLLDRDRPLWQLHVIEGLRGRRFAVFARVHHSMTDGVSGFDLLTVLLSPQTGIRPGAPRPYTPRQAPGGFALWRDEVRMRLTRPLVAARHLSAVAVSAARGPESLGSSIASLAELVRGMFRRPTPAPFNRPLSGRRRIEWLTVPLAPIAEIRDALGGSLNDVVLAVVAGAVRRYLIARGMDVGGIDFRAMTPVSTRGSELGDAVGNRVSAWLVELPIGEPDPRRQLHCIVRTTRAIKESPVPAGASVVTEMSETTSSTLLISLTARHLTRLLPCNMVVTNIPGPAVPVYMQSATLREAFPFVPLTDGLGLNIAVLSYDGRLCWGIHADHALVPDVLDFAGAIGDAFDALHRVALRGRARRARARGSVVVE